MGKYVYRPVRFYLITFACTWFWCLFAILFNEGTILYLGMFLGLISPAVVAIATVFTSKNKALINDFKTKLVVVIAAIIIVTTNKEMFFETKYAGNLLEE